MPRAKDPVHDHFDTTEEGTSRCNECKDYTSKSRDPKRLATHLASCTATAPDIREIYRQRGATAKASASTKRPRTDTSTTLPIISFGSTTANDTPSFGPGTVGSQQIQRWVDSVSAADQIQLERSLAGWIYSSGLPFSIVEHSGFQDFMTKVRPGFKIPSRKVIAATMLDDAYSSLRLQVRAKIGSTTTPRLTLVTDSWTNNRQESLTNFILVTPSGEAIFHSAEPSGQECHTAEFLAAGIEDVLRDIGPQNFNAICTDTAANIKAAVGIVVLRPEFQHIHQVGCTSHQLNLTIGDILKLEPWTTTCSKATQVAKWFRSHHVPLALLRSLQVQQHGKEISLQLPVPTRWQSNAGCFRSLLKSKEALQEVIAKQDVRPYIQRGKAGVEVKNTVQSEKFWEDLEDIQSVVEPFLKAIIKYESNLPQLSRIWTDYEHLTGITLTHARPETRDEVVRILANRSKKIRTPIMLLAAILDVSIPPDRKVCINPACQTAALAWLQGRYTCEKAAKIYGQLLLFINKAGIFENPGYWDTQVIQQVHARIWWTQFDCELSVLAQELLSIMPSSGAAERNWSTFGFIHSKLRNRLRNPRVEKLVYLYTNGRIFNRKTASQVWFADSDNEDGEDSGNDFGGDSEDDREESTEAGVMAEALESEVDDEYHEVFGGAGTELD
jgi:Protein of unknown function (DUF 659)/hAT family C-terminal dimerisation region